MKQRKLSILSGYWARYTRRLHEASWMDVLWGCLGVLFAGVVLQLTTLAKLIVAVSVLNKLWSQKATRRQRVSTLTFSSKLNRESE